MRIAANYTLRVSWSSWIFFAVTETLLCLTPGPAVLFVLSHGLARGAGSSLWASAGILAGNTFYFILTALGLGTILLASHQVFLVIKYVGAGYLVYLGIRTMMSSEPAVEREATAGGQVVSQDWRTLSRGFALQVANPQFINPASAIAPQVAILGTTSVAIEFLVLAAYGRLAARAAALAHQPRFVALTNRISGGMLVAAGAGIAFTRD
jgi:homoserine/homoserine lactone efflux protein